MWGGLGWVVVVVVASAAAATAAKAGGGEGSGNCSGGGSRTINSLFAQHSTVRTAIHRPRLEGGDQLKRQRSVENRVLCCGRDPDACLGHDLVPKHVTVLQRPEIFPRHHRCTVVARYLAEGVARVSGCPQLEHFRSPCTVFACGRTQSTHTAVRCTQDL